jgi:hypothetical protein
MSVVAVAVVRRMVVMRTLHHRAVGHHVCAGIDVVVMFVTCGRGTAVTVLRVVGGAVRHRALLFLFAVSTFPSSEGQAAR